MRNTQRNLNNIPTSLESLVNLVELDLSENALPKIPDAIYTLVSLKRLNLRDNEITDVSIGSYQRLINHILLKIGSILLKNILIVNFF